VKIREPLPYAAQDTAVSGGDDDGPGGDPFGGAIDLRDPDVVAALQVCQEEVNIGRFAGGGRGGNS